MRTTRVMLAALVLTGLIATNGAQEKPVAGFTCSTEGETLESFNVTCTAVTPLDQSSAEALAEGWIRLSDRRKENEAELAKVFDAWTLVLNKAMQPDAEKLLNKEAMELLAKGIKEDAAADQEYREASEFKPMQITESSEEEGKTLVVASQQHVFKSGEETNLVRLTCVKGDDSKWRVDKVEIDRRWQSQIQAGDPPKWEAVIPSDLGGLYYSRLSAGRKVNVAELSQESDESAARSLVTWLLMLRQKRHSELFLKHCDAYFKLQEQLYTPAWLEWAEKQLEGERGRGDIPDFELVKARTVDESDIHTVWFKLSYNGQTDFMRAIAVKVIKDGDAWKVCATGVSDTYGEAEGFQEVANIYSLLRRAG